METETGLEDAASEPPKATSPAECTTAHFVGRVQHILSRVSAGRAAAAGAAGLLAARKLRRRARQADRGGCGGGAQENNWVQWKRESCPTMEKAPAPSALDALPPMKRRRAAAAAGAVRLGGYLQGLVGYPRWDTVVAFACDGGRERAADSNALRHAATYSPCVVCREPRAGPALELGFGQQCLSHVQGQGGHPHSEGLPVAAQRADGARRRHRGGVQTEERQGWNSRAMRDALLQRTRVKGELLWLAVGVQLEGATATCQNQPLHALEDRNRQPGGCSPPLLSRRDSRPAAVRHSVLKRVVVVACESSSRGGKVEDRLRQSRQGAQDDEGQALYHSRSGAEGDGASGRKQSARQDGDGGRRNRALEPRAH
eukprot:scaffold585_cov311-Prasinococcus_capsulatus_cf.AAC.4